MIANKNCFACSTDGKPVSWIVIGVVVDASDLFMYFVISGSDRRLWDGDYMCLWAFWTCGKPPACDVR